MLGNDTAALLWVVFKQKTLLHPVVLLGYFELKQPNVLNFEAATNAQEFLSDQQCLKLLSVCPMIFACRFYVYSSGEKGIKSPITGSASVGPLCYLLLNLFSPCVIRGAHTKTAPHVLRQSSERQI